MLLIGSRGQATGRRRLTCIEKHQVALVQKFMQKPNAKSQATSNNGKQRAQSIIAFQMALAGEDVLGGE